MASKHIVLHELVLWSDREKAAAVAELVVAGRNVRSAASLDVRSTPVAVKKQQLEVYDTQIQFELKTCEAS